MPGAAARVRFPQYKEAQEVDKSTAHIHGSLPCADLWFDEGGQGESCRLGHFRIISEQPAKGDYGSSAIIKVKVDGEDEITAAEVRVIDGKDATDRAPSGRRSAYRPTSSKPAGWRWWIRSNTSCSNGQQPDLRGRVYRRPGTGALTFDCPGRHLWDVGNHHQYGQHHADERQDGRAQAGE